MTPDSSCILNDVNQFYDILHNMSLRRLSLQMFLLVMAAMTITSCAAIDNILATPTPIIPTETPVPTSTIVWFPPSATPTAQALSTKAPTPEMRPGVSSDLVTDDFSNPSDWDVASSNDASAEIDNNRITLAAQSEVYMLSLKHDLILSNYYAEITARPSICRADDNYGLIVRASPSQYYRFVLACDGTTRAERVSGGTRLVLQQPLPSGDVPPGAPGEVRIGVWAYGKEMRLFLNGRFQFSIIDPSFPSGTVGVFVRSAGNTPAVVSFSDLKIQSIDYVPPTSTPIP